MGLKTFENEIFLEIFYVNFDIIVYKKKFEVFFENILKNIPPKVVP